MTEWSIQPGETDKSFAAFQRYCELPPNERSLAKVSRLLGHQSNTTVENWSRSFEWVRRALAYDQFMANSAIELRKVGLTEAQENLISQTSVLVASMSNIAGRVIAKMDEDLRSGEGVDTKALARMVRAVHDLDTLARRNLGLPTSFKTETVDEPEVDNDVFYIGG